MRIPLAGPIDLLRIPAQAWQEAASLLPRLMRVVGDLEALIGEARAVIGDWHATQRQAQAEVEAVETTREYVHWVATQAHESAAGAAELLAEGAELADAAAVSLGMFRPAMTKLAPLVAQLADNVTTADISRLVDLLRASPAVLEQVQSDVLPVLSSLETVAPNIEELVTASAGLSEMVGSVPGMGKVKKRLEEQHREAEQLGSGPVA